MSKENGAKELKCFSSHKADSRKRNNCGSRLFVVPGSFFWPIHYWFLWILAFTSLFIISLVHTSGSLLSFSIAWKIARSWGEVEYITVVDPGEKPRGGRPLLFLDQTEARRAETNFFWDPRNPRPPPSFVKVWIRHCIRRNYYILVFSWLQPQGQGDRMTESKSP